MSRTIFAFFAAVVLAAAMCVPALAMPIDQSQTVDGLRIELQVLPPEPFHTAAQVAAGEARSGMLIVGGAAPIQPDAPSHPNHHLIVHVFNSATGKAETHARVRLAVQRMTAAHRPSGPPKTVPVVEMQVIGKGPASTHYGNNVDLRPGVYRVTAEADGRTASFAITL
ncbi:MAG: hypothetical protein ACREEW_12220 [Caulobacteraceae bacterium]